MEKSLLLNNNKYCGFGAALLVLLCMHAAQAQSGGMAGSYLRAPTAASMIAMGGAGTASPSYCATWWNPAQLCLAEKTSFSLGTGLYSLGRTEAYSSFEFRLPPRVGIGFFGLYRGDPFLDNLYNETEDKLNNGSFTSLTVKAALSYLVTRRLSAGISLGFFYQSLPTSYFEQTLYTSDATTIGGFTIGLQYKLTDSLVLALTLRDIDPLQALSGKPASTAFEWQIASQGSYSPMVTDYALPCLVLASAYKNRFMGYPLLWNLDVDAYLVDGTFTRLNYMEARIFTGAEWKRFKSFCIRAGISDITLTRALFEKGDDNVDYWRDFSVKVSAGFGWDVSILKKPVTVNYSLTTDKVWAGINQMLDVVYRF